MTAACQVLIPVQEQIVHVAPILRSGGVVLQSGYHVWIPAILSRDESLVLKHKATRLNQIIQDIQANREVLQFFPMRVETSRTGGRHLLSQLENIVDWRQHVAQVKEVAIWTVTLCHQASLVHLKVF
jgi:hypothetical protein